MMATNKITLAISSSAGRKRLQVEKRCTAGSLKTKIRDILSLDEDFKAVRDNGRGRPSTDVIKLIGTTSITTLNLKNGDIIHVSPLSGTRFQETESENQQNGGPSSSSASSSIKTSNSKTMQASPVAVLDEDKVDIELYKMDGKIKQGRTSSCNHKSDAACIYCTSKDPYDPEYLKKEGIKFMSFHSYLRKLDHEKGSLAKATLDEMNLTIKPGCTTHAPWPEGICSACQPPAITMNRQTYRHVDYITFENGDIVDNFLNFWRVTSHQRAGLLYGRYETFSGVPLGIQAVVTAIYEPAQQGTRDGIKLLPDEDGKLAKVDRIAKSLGLCRLGWIFTDLIQDSTGSIKHMRNADSHFLSAQECITAAHFQNMYPNITKKSSSQKYGSKQVTIVVTGDS
jgi:nuclear protein localization family protein 4